MKKNNKDISRHIVIFVEGDTDELFFKALVEHYKILVSGKSSRPSGCAPEGQQPDGHGGLTC